MHAYSFPRSGVVQALARIQDRFSRRVEIVANPAIAETLERNGVHVEYVDAMPYERWLHHITTWAIGLAPIWGEYDSYRSNIKVLEYALVGLPWVATRSKVYTGARGGIHVPKHNPSHWETRIARILECERLAEALSMSGQAWAREQTIDKVSDWDAVISFAQERVACRT